ncbi:MAG: hypothetical protein ACOYOK_04525, partial [Pseudobdellovibrionaceae bacterium]
LKKYSLDENNQLAYLSFVGPTRIIETDLSEIPGQGFNYHKDGFSTAIGDFSFVLNGHEKKSTAADFVESLPMLIDTGQVKLQFRSGVVVVGELKSIVYSINDQKPIILRFLNCTVTYKDKTLYRPTWGTYDMVLGSFINDIADSPGQF